MARDKHVPRVFVEADLAEGAVISLSDAKRHHLATVLRACPGDAVTLFNGDGAEYAARLTVADRRRAEVRIEARAEPRRESPLEITLVQAVARGDRMDFALAKAVELGVSAIQPVFTARGQVKLDARRLAKKQAHWRRVVESAAEQSGRLIRPALADAVDLATLTENPPDVERLLMLAPEAATGLHAQVPARRIALLVGPESGLSDNEIAHASDAGWQALALGPRILRTETAGMAALAALQTVWGDLSA